MRISCIWASMLTITPPRLPGATSYPRLPAYVVPFMRGQCSVLQYKNHLLNTGRGGRIDKALVTGDRGFESMVESNQ